MSLSAYTCRYDRKLQCSIKKKFNAWIVPVLMLFMLNKKGAPGPKDSTMDWQRKLIE
jgi:hypothetical protein